MDNYSIQAVLDAWYEGKPVWLDGEKRELDQNPGNLGYFGGQFPWVMQAFGFGVKYKTVELTPPEPPKKKTRKMTALEGYKFLLDGKRVFRNKRHTKNYWKSHGLWKSSNRVSQNLYADIDTPDFPHWKEFPMVEVEDGR